MTKAGAPLGNDNAKKGKYPREVFSLSGPTWDLLLDYLALQGNREPSHEEKEDAIYYALRVIYGRKIEDEKAMIV